MIGILIKALAAKALNAAPASHTSSDACSIKSCPIRAISVPLFTAAMFVALFTRFGVGWHLLGMCALTCTLITVTVTDLKERLIPHDITYPSILLGLLYSTLIRHSFLSPMVGIAVAYLLFDFIAHYGQKLYVRYHAESPDLEVMGGGDAVLAAVIAAWLGLPRLLLALATAFLVGTIMGTGLVLKDLHRSGALHTCVRPAAIGAILGFVALMLPVAFLSWFISSTSASPNLLLPILLPMGLLGAALGSIFGIIKAGKNVSKPFPFGPALAAGGFVAMFCPPLA